MEYIPGDNTTFIDNVEVFPPAVVPPNEASVGNVPPPVDPAPEVHYYSYELNIALTGLVWTVGSPIDTGMVRQYIIDRGYSVISVDAQTDAAGLATGLLTVRTNPVGTQIYPTVTFSIEDATESNTTAIVTAQVKIVSTAIATLPAAATFSGTVRFAANVRRSVATGIMGITPIVQGVDGTFVSIAGNDVDAPIYADIAVSGFVGGTAPTFGLKYRGGTTAGTTYISDVVISGDLIDGVEAPGTQITVPHWAAYNGTRFTGIVETIITWGNTAEGGLMLPPGGTSTNLLPNPSAETNLANSTPVAIQPALARVTTPGVVSGTYAVQVTCDGTASYQGVAYSTATGLGYTGTARTFIGSINVLGTGTVAFLKIQALYTDATYTDIVTSNVTLNPAGSRLVTPSVTTNPAKVLDKLTLFVHMGVSPFTAITFYTDAAQIEEKPSATPYLDGSLGAGYTWSGTAHASTSTRTSTAVHPSPDLSRIVALWQYLEANDYEIQQITGGWNFTTPATAPVGPVLRVYARGAITTLISNAFLYSEIEPAALDAFRTDWSAVETMTRMERKVSGDITTDEYEYSSPYVFISNVEPVDDDIREGDIWRSTTQSLMRSQGEWVPLAAGYNPTGEGSLALGRRAKASGAVSLAVGPGAESTNQYAVAVGGEAKATNQLATAVGRSAEANGAMSLALGSGAKAHAEASVVVGRLGVIPSTSPRSSLIGANHTFPDNTPDTGLWLANSVRVRRSSGTGQTTLLLQAPDGFLNEISVTNDYKLLVNGIAQNIPAASTITSAMIVDATIVLGDLAAATVTSLKSEALPQRKGNGKAAHAFNTGAIGTFAEMDTVNARVSFTGLSAAKQYRVEGTLTSDVVPAAGQTAAILLDCITQASTQGNIDTTAAGVAKPLHSLINVELTAGPTTHTFRTLIATSNATNANFNNARILVSLQELP